MSIDCKKCGTEYCPVCKDKCPNCGEVDTADDKTIETRRQMKHHMNKVSVDKLGRRKAEKYLKQI